MPSARRPASLPRLVLSLPLSVVAGVAGTGLSAGWWSDPIAPSLGLGLAAAAGAAFGAALGAGLRIHGAIAGALSAAGIVLASLVLGQRDPADGILALLGALPGLALILAARALVGRARIQAACSVLGLAAGALTAILLIPRTGPGPERGPPPPLPDPGVAVASTERGELAELGSEGLELLRAIDRLNAELRQRGLARAARDPAGLRRVEQALRELHAEMRRRVAAGADPDRFRGFLSLEARVIALLARAEQARSAPERRVRRIASLSPANTEILFALGCGDRVVLRDPVSAFPREVLRLPASNPFQLSVEHLAGFAPDLVLLSHVDSARLRALHRIGLRVETFDARTLEVLFADIEKIGELCGAAARARPLVASLRERAARVARAVAGRPRPRVYVETDGSDPLKPWVAGPGSFVAHLLDLAGGANLFPRLERAVAQVNVEQIVAARPELVLLMNVEQGSGTGVARLRARPVFGSLAAVRAGRVIDSIHPDLLSRPGPRAIDGLEQLARALHPAAFEAKR